MSDPILDSWNIKPVDDAMMPTQANANDPDKLAAGIGVTPVPVTKVFPAISDKVVPQQIDTGMLYGNTVIQKALLTGDKRAYGDAKTGVFLGIDDGVPKFEVYGDANNYIQITPSGVTVKGTITASAGTIGGFTISATTLAVGKTSYSDTVNAGIILGLDGATPSFYYGTADDVSYMKLVSGVYEMVGQISGRSTLTLASAVNSDGNLITDVINLKLDTSAKTILDAFTFGTSGAIQIGSYINGVSGDIRLSPNGIVGRDSTGTTTFSIDGTTGNATFSGTLSAASGTFGALTVASGGHIKGGQTDYDTGTGFFLGLNAGDYKFSVGSSTNYLKWDGDNLAIKGVLDLSDFLNLKTYTVATLPTSTLSEGFNSPSATS